VVEELWTGGATGNKLGAGVLGTTCHDFAAGLSDLRAVELFASLGEAVASNLA